MSRPFLATYRVQLTPDQDFAAVHALVPYLRRLGVSHLYLSPSLTARSGSTHGYDVVDPTTVSAALGGEEGLRALADAGLGILLDVVPNHMGTGDENRWWADEAERARVFDYDPSDGWYRRFFDIDDLAGVRVEDPEVFDLTHRKVLELVADGVVDGLRIDHPDGLADPAGYLRRLREHGVRHVWVEKILSAEDPVEALPDWPVEGTVGYEFLNDATALFVDPAGREPLRALHAELTGETRPFEAVALEAQLEQATTTFAREVDRLRALHDVPGIADALAHIPVYRSYVDPRTGAVSDDDREVVAASRAGEGLRRALLLEDRGHDEFVSRFQQTSPPVTAKGVEDTAFYRWCELVALNEVGGEPGRFSLPVDAFHAANAARAERSPRGLLASQTHDTKRSGDVRARIGALAGRAGEWEDHVRRWWDANAPLREAATATAGRDGAVCPSPAEEYLLYQTLLGAWPIDAGRLEQYLEKALREGKRTTTWADPDEAWERGVLGFATGLLDHAPFLETFVPFAQEVAAEGRRSALGQLLLRLTVPGVPDVYQGDELESLSLVDPDNRRPVDWAARVAALDDLGAGGRVTDANAKLDLLRRGLALRGRVPQAFDGGAYRSLPAGDDVCAFVRADRVLAAVRLRGDADVGAATVPADLAGRWRDALTDRPVDVDAGTTVAALLDERGLALLEREAEGGA